MLSFAAALARTAAAPSRPTSLVGSFIERGPPGVSTLRSPPGAVEIVPAMRVAGCGAGSIIDGREWRETGLAATV